MLVAFAGVAYTGGSNNIIARAVGAVSATDAVGTKPDGIVGAVRKTIRGVKGRLFYML